jgi:hypothetical protein
MEIPAFASDAHSSVRCQTPLMGGRDPPPVSTGLRTEPDARYALPSVSPALCFWRSRWTNLFGNAHSRIPVPFGKICGLARSESLPVSRVGRGRPSSTCSWRMGPAPAYDTADCRLGTQAQTRQTDARTRAAMRRAGSVRPPGGRSFVSRALHARAIRSARGGLCRPPGRTPRGDRKAFAARALITLLPGSGAGRS